MSQNTETTNFVNNSKSCKVIIEGFPSIIQSEKDQNLFFNDLYLIESVYTCPVEFRDPTPQKPNYTYEQKPLQVEVVQPATPPVIEKTDYTPYIISALTTITVISVVALGVMVIKNLKGK